MTEEEKAPEIKEEEEKKEEVEIEYLKEKEVEEKESKEKTEEKDEIKAKLKKKEGEIKRLKKENTQLKEEYLRQLAEKENLKKRLEREKAEYYQYALSELLKELLEILDNFERALESSDQTDGKSFKEGVELIYKQYQNFLSKQGVTPIEIKGKKFDPHMHQAFITEESEEVEEPEIAAELQKGYTIHNRLLRPALVKVVIPKKDK